jgi:hypothetical protein
MRSASTGTSTPTKRRTSYGDLTFDPPEHWSERSIFIVVAPPSTDAMSAANIVVTREERPAGEGLEVHARRQLRGAAAAHPDLRLVEARSEIVAGRPAFRVRFSFTGSAGALEQIVVYVDVRDPSSVTALWASGRPDGGWRAAFDRLLASSRVDAPLSPAIPPPVVALPPRAPLAVDPPWNVPCVPIPGARAVRRTTR